MKLLSVLTLRSSSSESSRECRMLVDLCLTSAHVPRTHMSSSSTATTVNCLIVVSCGAHENLDELVLHSDVSLLLDRRLNHSDPPTAGLSGSTILASSRS